VSEQIDLRRWGYAPGGYSFKCIDCPPDTDPMSQWAAKRAWRCEKHALEAKAKDEEIGESAPAAGASETAVDGCQSEFEAWARNAVPQFTAAGHHGYGGAWVYRHNIVNLMWQCWLAARK
jgi:hypothetical protein